MSPVSKDQSPEPVAPNQSHPPVHSAPHFPSVAILAQASLAQVPGGVARDHRTLPSSVKPNKQHFPLPNLLESLPRLSWAARLPGCQAAGWEKTSRWKPARTPWGQAGCGICVGCAPMAKAIAHMVLLRKPFSTRPDKYHKSA